MNNKKHIIHIITSLGNGGAEATLYRLCTNDHLNQHSVISMLNDGIYGELLRKKGIPVYSLNMTSKISSIYSSIKLYRIIKKINPDIVQTWMYHADLFGGIVARIAGMKKIFWNIRHTVLEKGISKRSTMFIAKLCAKLSHYIPYKIICCATSAIEVHSNIGYKKEKMIVIGNGYDLGKFTPDSQKKQQVKLELKISNKILIGMIARYDPLKDHTNLLNSLALLKNYSSNFLCLLVGTGITVDNKELVKKIWELDLDKYVTLLGQRKDIPAIMNALDIKLLSSRSEGFPNVLAEAMACGVPCVTTNVGDAAVIVDKFGWIVPPKKPQSLADAIYSAIKEIENTDEWLIRKKECRQHISDNFSIETMIKNYNNAWSK